MFTDPLASNGRPIVVCVGSGRNVFTASLPSNESIRHNTIPEVYNKHLNTLCGARTRLLRQKNEIVVSSPIFTKNESP
jgi:hypothetical protein